MSQAPDPPKGAPEGDSPEISAGEPIAEGTRQASAPGPVGRTGGGRGPRPFFYTSRDLTSGSVPRHVASLAWPQVGENILNIIDQLVDMVWAGRLPGGFRAVAGVGVAQTFSQFGMMTRQGADQAMRAMVSRAVGMGNIPLANHVTLQAFTLSIAYSVFVVIVGWLLTDVLIRVIGASEAVKAETAMYMRIQFIGTATMAFRMMSGAALQSTGQVMVPLLATFVTRLVHIVFTPFLMFGWWWFPNLGLPGAATVNVLAQLAGFAINIYVLFKGYSRLHLTLRGYRLDFPILRQIIVIGVPASIAGTERAAAQLILLRLVAPFGDVAMAAYALTRRMEMLVNFGGMGVGQASGIMVGQNLGARRPDRARRSVGWALLYVTIMGGSIFILVMFFPEGFVALFSRQPEVVALASDWLRILAVAGLFMGTNMVFQQSYNTAGDTLAPMVITLLTVWGVELPMAWLLSFTLGVGPLGIGYAGVIGTVARLLSYGAYFFRGRWLRVRVI